MDAAILHEIDRRLVHEAKLKCVRFHPLCAVSTQFDEEQYWLTVVKAVE